MDRRWRTLSREFFGASVMGMVLTIKGFYFALNSVLLIQETGGGDLTRGQVTWLLSVGYLTVVAGCVLALALAPLLGTRRLLMASMPVCAGGAALQAFGGSFWTALVGCIVVHFVLGLTEGAARSYVSEVVSVNRRALFTAYMSCELYLGQLIGLAVGSQFHWTVMAAVAGCAPAALCLLALPLLPNSPKWLLAHGHSEQEAREALRFFCGRQTDVAPQLEAVRRSLPGTGAPRLSALLRTALTKSHTLRPLLLACAQFLLFVWCGGFGLVTITAFILAPAPLPISDYQRAMLVLAIPLLLALPTSLVIERYGRLPMLQLCGSVIATGCTIISAYYYLADRLKSQAWLVLLGAGVIQSAFVCILASITFNYVSELIPNCIRAVGSSIVIAFYNSNGFIFMLVYRRLVGWLGFGTMFLIHAVISLILVAYATFVLPETKGLSLEEIQYLFHKSQKPTEPTTHEAEYGGGHDNLAMCDVNTEKDG